MDHAFNHFIACNLREENLIFIIKSDFKNNFQV